MTVFGNIAVVLEVSCPIQLCADNRSIFRQGTAASGSIAAARDGVNGIVEEDSNVCLIGGGAFGFWLTIHDFKGNRSTHSNEIRHIVKMISWYMVIRKQSLRVKIPMAAVISAI